MADLINVDVEFLCPLWLQTTSLIRASSLGLSRLNSEQVSRYGGHLLSEGREMELRPLHPLDETDLCRVIRAALVEFGADRPGFAWQDPELDAMSKTYAASGWIYLVVAEGGNVLGGAGIGPLSGVDATCELQKMYLAPSARGKGVGWQLMGSLLEHARVLGYRWVYLETLSGMVAAQRLYRAWGFLRIEQPLGQTGHGGCDCWFLKELHGAGGSGKQRSPSS